MAIDSISRNTNTSATRQSVENRLTQEAKQSERQAAKAQEFSKRKAEGTLQPVVNTRGQATGTQINVTA